MSWTLKAHVLAQSAGSNSITTGAISTIGADLITIVAIDYAAIGAAAISDNQSNIYTADSTHTENGVVRTRILHKVSPTTNAAHTFTATVTAGYPAIAVIAWSGSQTSSNPFDVENGNGAIAVTSLTTGSITPSVNGELLIIGGGFSGVGNPGSPSVNSGFTVEDTAVNIAATAFGILSAYFVQTSAAAINPTVSWTGSDNPCVAITSFKVASAAVTDNTEWNKQITLVEDNYGQIIDRLN